MTDAHTISWPGWNVVRCIGKGGFGAVYEIERDVFGKQEKAALKVMSIPESRDEIDDLFNRGYNEESITDHFKNYLEEIVKEYSIMSDLKGHTNIVYCDELRYVQHDDGIGWDIYIKMELLSPLDKSLGLTYSESDTIRLGIDLCNALIHCKRGNIIHRDIKPQNILVSKSGDYKLGDFGVAKVSDKTMSGTKIGTYEYMAPEVYKAEHYGSTADIYSLGLVMYWMMNCRTLPFLPLYPKIPSSSEKEAARSRRFSGEPLPPPVNGSKALQDIVLKACAFDQKSRYASAMEMRSALLWLQSGEDETETVLTGETPPVTVSSSGRMEPGSGTSAKKKQVRRPKSNRRLPVAATVLLLLLAGCMGFLFYRSGSRSDLPLPETPGATVQDSQPPETTVPPSTEPPTEAPTLSAEDIAYRDTEEYCALLDAQGNTFVALRHLQVMTESSAHDPRYDSLLAFYEEKIRESALTTAAGYAGQQEYGKALQALWDTQLHYDCPEFHTLITEYIQTLSRSPIAAGKLYSAFINNDGSVSVCQPAGNLVDVAKQWTDIISVTCGDYYFAALSADGTVKAAGHEYYYAGSGQWTDIKVLAAGDGHLVGLKTDGTLVGTGKNAYGQLKFESLYSGATIVSVAAGYRHTVVLRDDGTVSAIGNNEYGQCNVSGWTNIIAISAGSDFSLGLQHNGTAVAVGINEDEQCYVDNWSDVIAIGAGNHHCVGLTRDGQILSAGDSTRAQFRQ